MATNELNPVVVFDAPGTTGEGVVLLLMLELTFIGAEDAVTKVEAEGALVAEYDSLPPEPAL